MENTDKSYIFLKKYLEKIKKRGIQYDHPIKVEDIVKMPRFRDSDFRYKVVENAYKEWRKSAPKELVAGFGIRKFEKIWKHIADELFGEMEDNYNGVKLPDQMGVLYIGTPLKKDFYTFVDLPKYKHIIWRTRLKYVSRDLRYYFFNSYHKRYKSAYERDEYYKTAVEKIPRHTYLR